LCTKAFRDFSSYLIERAQARARIEFALRAHTKGETRFEFAP